MSRAPSLFISHGSPMFSIEPGELGPNLRQLGRTLAVLLAIVVVSPHWQTQGVRVGATAMPETIHDFSGFPAPLYELQYTPPGERKSITLTSSPQIASLLLSKDRKK